MRLALRLLLDSIMPPRDSAIGLEFKVYLAGPMSALIASNLYEMYQFESHAEVRLEVKPDSF